MAAAVEALVAAAASSGARTPHSTHHARHTVRTMKLCRQTEQMMVRALALSASWLLPPGCR